MMAEHYRAIGSALSPISASHIREKITCESGAIGPRTGKHVVFVGLFRAAIHKLSLFVHCRVFGKVIVSGVEFFQVLGDHDAFGILPRTSTNSIAGVGSFNLGAQVCAPSLVPGPDCRG